MRRYIQLVCMAVAFILMGNELSAKIVEGRVVCGTTKLENVIVSDGAKNITIHIQNPFGKKWVEEVNL